jgi:hypothetical protein
MDGGSADFAGAKICPPILGHKKASGCRWLFLINSFSCNLF